MEEEEGLDSFVQALPEREKYVGPFSIKRELDSLNKETFDSLNFEEKLARPFGVLNSLDSAIRTNFDKVQEGLKDLKKIENSDSFRGKDWTGNKWYLMYQDLKKILNGALDIYAYKDVQIEFLSRMLNKLSQALKSIKGVSKEQTIVETMKTVLTEDRKASKQLIDELRQERAEEARRTREWQQNFMMQVFKVAGLKDGVKIAEKEKEIAEKDKEIMKLREKLKESKKVLPEEELKEVKEEETKEKVKEEIEVEKPADTEKMEKEIRDKMTKSVEKGKHIGLISAGLKSGYPNELVDKVRREIEEEMSSE